MKKIFVISRLIFCIERCPSVWATIEAHTHFQSLDKKILKMGGSTEYFFDISLILPSLAPPQASAQLEG